jgi:hypothetical protein
VSINGCPACSEETEAGSRFCRSCGATLASLLATAIVASVETPAQHPVSKRPVSEGRFVPGTVLAGRYRLVALLGKGGMGEVYRAEDTRLGQTVALKFLPDTLARDREMLERFYAEVRIGRQVSHPNVCRLYDLVEIEGHHCLSMEYVDGEDLSSLLARIGRLPAEKAIDLARDICAGIAAAHDMGVIHRDLKPANIMVDGKGRARIADFGVAALADRIEREAAAGTPAYMAPELLAGQPASTRSDIYALGLVLFELCTGKRRFEARTLEELRDLQMAAEPPSLSSSAPGIPLALERIVRRCLDPEPAARPASAHLLMAALPGGDPLQAAMAAGETPSPAMVAAAGAVGALSTPAAWILLICVIGGLLLATWLAGSSTLIGRMAPAKSPAVLSEKAQEILMALGHPESARYTHASFTVDARYVRHLREAPSAQQSWSTIRDAQPGPMLFEYRQSRAPLVAERTLPRPFGPFEVGRVTLDDPPTTRLGMVDILLDLRGRLVGLRAVAPGLTGTPGQADWRGLLASTGIDRDSLRPAQPRWHLPIHADTRIAWRGSFPDQPDVEFQLEAAALNGTPVWFAMQGPWAGEDPVPALGVRAPSSLLAVNFQITFFTVMGFTFCVFVAIGVLVRRNLNLGRADRRGALRLSLSLLLTTFMAQMLRADHIPLAFEQAALFINSLAQVLCYFVIIWLSYIALEPIARRRWPTLLVGWSRLLAGRWRDPLVGRDVLIGTVGGILLALIVQMSVVVPEWLGQPSPGPRGQVFTSLAAMRHLGYFVLWSPYAAVNIGFGTLLGLMIFRAILRNYWLALAAVALTLYFGFGLFTGFSAISVAGAVFAALYLFIALRAGLLSAVVSFYVFLVLEATPLTLDASAWYADRTLLSLGVLGGLAIYGFTMALAGKPLLGKLLTERDGEAQ